MTVYYEIIKKQIIGNDKVLIAIDGPSGSGKSTLSEILKEKFDALLFHTDCYFLPEERKTSERLNEVGGNLDYEWLKVEIIDNLNKDYITSNNFNCSTEELEFGIPQTNNQVIIIEGVYSMHKTLLPFYTLSIFLDIDKDKQRERILLRNGEKMLDRWLNEWIPLENNYFEKENLRAKADVLLNQL